MEITSSVTANANAASTKVSSRVTWRPRCTKPSAIRGACASPVAFIAPPFPPHSPGAAAAAARLQDMFTTDSLSGSKPEQYAQLARQARALVAGERDRIANAANLSALVYHALPRLNWVGFYFFDRSEEHTSELQSLMRISYAVFCLKKKNIKQTELHSIIALKTH